MDTIARGWGARGWAARALPVAGLILGAWLLGRQADAVDAGALLRAIAATPLSSWVAALLLTFAAFDAIGRAEAALHEGLGTGVAPRRAARAGAAAVAVTQVVGFGGVTGAVVRWRRLPEMTLRGVGALSVLSTGTFLLGLAGLGALVAAMGRGPVTLGAVLGLGVVLLALLRLPPARLPGLTRGVALRLLLWTAADLLCAAGVLWALLDGAVAPGVLVPAFLAATAAGLLSQSPGGVGVFEATLLALLPGVPAGDLLAAILCYRLAYQAFPALLALSSLLRVAPPPALALAEGAPRAGALARAPQAEWGLAHQGAGLLLSADGARGWLVRVASGWLVALGPGLGDTRPGELRARARADGLRPLMYKTDARGAAAARAAGWRAVRLGDEAVLALSFWRLDAPACRSLRRKLRAAASAGVEAREGAGSADLLDVQRAWLGAHGRERGFSMGRFEPSLLARQRVVVARAGGVAVGFASFHATASEWSLDLLRCAPGAPDGAMHAVLAEAAALARAAGAGRLSLAAVPLDASDLWRQARGLPVQGGTGLGRFKAAFGPRLLPRYAAAPSLAGLVLGLLAVAWAVHRPPKLTFEPPARPCDAQARAQAPHLRRPPA